MLSNGIVERCSAKVKQCDAPVRKVKAMSCSIWSSRGIATYSLAKQRYCIVVTGVATV